VGFTTSSRGEVLGKSKPVIRGHDDNDDDTTENWYSHIPKSVTECEDITMLWNEGVKTDREVLANRPDIIVKNKKGRTCLLTDVAIASDRNIIQKEAEKKLKYKNLNIEIQQKWNMKCFVITATIGATGLVS
jgi:hypothetical protein